MTDSKEMRRRVLVISRNEQVGKWFRFMLGGRRTGMPTTVVTDLEKGIRALKRLRPRAVIFVEESAEKIDDRLMLLRALLLVEEQGRQNTLAILYDLAEGRLTMYHNAFLPRVSAEDVVQAAVETVACPLFGYADETAPGFPKDCRFLPLMMKGAAGAAGTDSHPSLPLGGGGQRRG